MNGNLVSVIMPAYNAAVFIAQSIASVRQQTVSDWELLIVDDGSTDETFGIARRAAASDPRIRLYRNAHPGGPASARNLAIREARGRYIAFLDSDDLWASAKLEIQLQRMAEAGASLSFTAYKKIDTNGRIGHAIIEVPPTTTYAGLLKSNVIGCLTAVYDTEQLGKLYMPEDSRREDYRLWLQILKHPKVHEDYALWLRILREGDREDHRTRQRVIGINEVLAFYRVHDGGVSSNKLHAMLMQWRVYRNVEKLSWLKASYNFVHYSYHGYRKWKKK